MPRKILDEIARDFVIYYAREKPRRGLGTSNQVPRMIVNRPSRTSKQTMDFESASLDVNQQQGHHHYLEHLLVSCFIFDTIDVD